MVTPVTPNTEHEFADYFRRHEGVVDHFYLDAVGLVTVGVGLMLPHENAAAQLNLVHVNNGSAALDGEKRDEWRRVKAMAPNRLPGYYRTQTRLQLSQAEIARLLSLKLAEFEVCLRRMFPRYSTLPRPARLGLLDMIYSLGEGGLPGKFPKLCAAARRGDWIEVAEECARGGVSVSRNADCKRLFIDAAVEVA